MNPTLSAEIRAQFTSKETSYLKSLASLLPEDKASPFREWAQTWSDVNRQFEQQVNKNVQNGSPNDENQNTDRQTTDEKPRNRRITNFFPNDLQVDPAETVERSALRKLDINSDHSNEQSPLFANNVARYRLSSFLFSDPEESTMDLLFECRSTPVKSRRSSPLFYPKSANIAFSECDKNDAVPTVPTTGDAKCTKKQAPSLRTRQETLTDYVVKSEPKIEEECTSKIGVLLVKPERVEAKKGETNLSVVAEIFQELAVVDENENTSKSLIPLKRMTRKKKGNSKMNVEPPKTNSEPGSANALQVPAPAILQRAIRGGKANSTRVTSVPKARRGDKFGSEPEVGNIVVSKPAVQARRATKKDRESREEKGEKHSSKTADGSSAEILDSATGIGNINSSEVSCRAPSDKPVVEEIPSRIVPKVNRGESRRTKLEVQSQTTTEPKKTALKTLSKTIEKRVTRSQKTVSSVKVTEPIPVIDGKKRTSRKRNENTLEAAAAKIILPTGNNKKPIKSILKKVNPTTTINSAESKTEVKQRRSRRISITVSKVRRKRSSLSNVTSSPKVTKKRVARNEPKPLNENASTTTTAPVTRVLRSRKTESSSLRMFSSEQTFPAREETNLPICPPEHVGYNGILGSAMSRACNDKDNVPSL